VAFEQTGESDYRPKSSSGSNRQARLISREREETVVLHLRGARKRPVPIS